MPSAQHCRKLSKKRETIMKKTILAVLVTASLAGCAQTGVPELKNLYVAPPDALLVKATVEAPPDQTSYGTLSWKQRSDLWESKYDAQTANVATANRHISSLQDWKTQNNAVFAASPQGASNVSGTRP
jgi:hypothetical protein